MTDVGSLFDRKRVTGYTSPTEILALSGLKSGTDGVGDGLPTILPKPWRHLMIVVFLSVPNAMNPWSTNCSGFPFISTRD